MPRTHSSRPLQCKHSTLNDPLFTNHPPTFAAFPFFFVCQQLCSFLQIWAMGLPNSSSALQTKRCFRAGWPSHSFPTAPTLPRLLRAPCCWLLPATPFPFCAAIGRKGGILGHCEVYEQSFKRAAPTFIMPAGFTFSVTTFLLETTSTRTRSRAECPGNTSFPACLSH